MDTGVIKEYNMKLGAGTIILDSTNKELKFNFNDWTDHDNIPKKGLKVTVSKEEGVKAIVEEKPLKYFFAGLFILLLVFFVNYTSFNGGLSNTLTYLGYFLGTVIIIGSLKRLIINKKK